MRFSLLWLFLASVASPTVVASVIPPNPTTNDTVYYVTNEYATCFPEPTAQVQGFQVTITDLGGLCFEGSTSVRLGVLPAGTYAVAVRLDTSSAPYRQDSFVVTWAAPIPLFNGPTGLALLSALAVLGTLLLGTGRHLAP
ncbi:MAG: hypothetical protein QOC81_3518 [Thermoanaerobaculia bacterium]|jgi:hypothetical protein|nr:hypothetical protein [Thermoanaerobaculia bacterium]